MTLLAPTERLLQASLQALLPKFDPDDRVVAFQASSEWAGPAHVTVRRGENPVEFRVVGCGSALAVREALVERAVSDGHLVILTGRPGDDLGDDVLARVFKGRVVPLDPWEAVKVAFQARLVDPALTAHAWLPEALLECVPTGGFPPVPAGFLDAETAWRWALGAWGLAEATPPLEAIIRWALDPANVSRWRAAPADRRDGATAWLVSRAGAAQWAARSILRLAEHGKGESALSLGLALGVVFDPEHRDDATLKSAGIRMEAVLGTPTVEPDIAVAWAEAASSVVASLVAESGRKGVQSYFDAAERTLGEVQAEGHAHVSPWLPRGLTQRLERYAVRLRKALDANPVVRAEDLEGPTRAVLEHRLARFNETDSRTVEMATRLVRWLASRHPATDGERFEPLLGAYARDGGFVDWARADLASGGSVPGLTEALERLRARIDAIRQDENTRFAAELARWLESGATTPLPIERVLDEVLAPLAEDAPVLLLVLDGMSMPVFRELLEDITRQGWTELLADEPNRRGPAVAVLPSVTEMSRASLFAGRLVRGDSNSEKQGFAAHPRLRQIATKAKPPLLIHKDELTRGGTGLTADAAEAIADGGRKIIGIVVNTVDDWLLKGDQMRPSWTLTGIVPLEGILAAARDAGRHVVLLSDHGHVIERGTEFRAAATEGERWRFASEPATEGEVRLGGPRVHAVVGRDIVVPSTERLRYGAKRNGYHGGATPQEVAVPLAVLTLSDKAPDGWRESTSWVPDWWRAGPLPTSPTAAPTTAKPARPTPGPRPATRPGQRDLFSQPEPPVPTLADTSPPASVPAAWVSRLLASATFKEQLRRCGRLGLDAERARRFLEALSERGGRLPLDALARRLELPPVRLPGLVAAMRRVLNLDGCATLVVDEASSTVIVNTDLVESLFGSEE